MVSFVGVLLAFGFYWGGVVIVPEILDTPFIEDGPERAAAIWILRLRIPLMTIGFLLVAVATLRAGILSGIGAWLLVVGTVAGAISTLWFAALLRPGAILAGIGFAWLGWSVIRVSGPQKIATP